MKFIIFTIVVAVLTKVYTFDQHFPNNIKSRISNGIDVVNIENYNYQVGIMLFDNKGNQFWCGGSILSSVWILTAAHCLRNMEHATLYFGTINKWQPEKGSILVNVAKDDFIIHDYNSVTRQNDIALIKLKNRISFSDRIKPINLIYNAYSATDEFDNKYADISGWGATSNDPKSSSTILQTATVKILPEKDCQHFYSKFVKITSTQICTTGTNSTGACKGDSGGPLVIQINGRIYQIGIVSFTKAQSCEKSVPRVYTRVSEYLPWVCSKTGICQIYMPKD